MTQTLDVHARISELDRSAPVSAAAARTGASTDRFATFAITFGIAFAILYTVFERLNWPLFTYHPAVGKVDFWMHAARSGEGPPMYWYGWVFLAGPAALVVASAAALMPRRLLQEATFFCCTLAILWPIVLAIRKSVHRWDNVQRAMGYLGLVVRAPGICGGGSSHLFCRAGMGRADVDQLAGGHADWRTHHPRLLPQDLFSPVERAPRLGYSWGQ